MSKITVLHGGESIQMQDVATVEDVISRLGVPDETIITVEDKVADTSTQLRDGDVVKILPRAGKNNA